MKLLKKILLSSIITFEIMVLHISVTHLFSYPFNTLHVALLFLSFLIVLKKTGTVVWISFSIGFVFDLMSASTFGIFLISYTLTILLLYWLFRDVLTHHSIWSITALVALGNILFRILYTLGLSMTQDIIFSDVFIYYLWEIIMTTVVSIGLYYIFGLHKKIYRA